MRVSPCFDCGPAFELVIGVAPKVTVGAVLSMVRVPMLTAGVTVASSVLSVHIHPMSFFPVSPDPTESVLVNSVSLSPVSNTTFAKLVFFLCSSVYVVGSSVLSAIFMNTFAPDAVTPVTSLPPDRVW